MNLPNPGFAIREELACRLEDAGWPSVADDVRDGIPSDVILERLSEIGEGHSDAYQIIAEGV